MSRVPATLGRLAPVVGYHLRRASALVAADFATVMADTGLRQVTLAALCIVAANPDIRQGAVARMLGIKRANMVALVSELIERGLIERIAVPSDRRVVALRITAVGEALLDRALTLVDAHEDRLLAALSHDERRTLLDLLDRIAV